MSDVVIRAEGLGKRYRVPHGGGATPDTAAGALAQALGRLGRGGGRRTIEEFWAVRDVSFDLHTGEVLGIVGSNGAGKSTLLKLLARVTEPTEGRAVVRGRLGSLLEVGTGFHGDLSGRDNIYLNGAILGMRRAEIDQRFDDIVEFAGVERFLDMQVKHYSSGMYVRLAFAVAAHLEPDILIVDEVLSVGDQAFQERCLGRMQQVTEAGRTVIFVSHNMASLANLCTRGILVREGTIAFDGTIDATIETYLAGMRRLGGGGTLEGVDREGSGAVRFRSIDLLGPDGRPEVYAGRELTVRVRLGAERPLPGRQLNLGIGINDQLGGRLATLFSRYDPSGALASADVRDGTEVVCRLPALPLRPGRYLLSLYVDRGGTDVLDRIRNQVELTVLPSDFYGTGEIPTDSQGPLLLAQEWAVREPYDVSVGARP